MTRMFSHELCAKRVRASAETLTLAREERSPPNFSAEPILGRRRVAFVTMLGYVKTIDILAEAYHYEMVGEVGWYHED
jgi:hypothetical protein